SPFAPPVDPSREGWWRCASGADASPSPLPSGVGSVAMRRWAHRTHLAGLLLSAVLLACRQAERSPSHQGVVVTDDAGRRAGLGPPARRLCVLTGRVASADSLARAMDSPAAAPPQPLTPGPQSLVFIVWDNPPSVIGAGSYLDRLASLAGARNVFHDIAAPSAQVSIETIAARDPDFVAVLSDSAVPPRYAGR